jgi:hypothetical protein
MNKIYNQNIIGELPTDIMFENNVFSDHSVRQFILSDDYDDIILDSENAWDT